MPQAIITLWEKASATLFSLVSVGCLALGGIVTFARLDPAIGELDRKMTEAKATQIEAATRIDRLDQSRTLDLQRLAKTEEAVTALKDLLAKIDAKVDRLLIRSDLIRINHAPPAPAGGALSCLDSCRRPSRIRSVPSARPQG